MLSKKYRLTRDKEIQSIQKNGRSFFTKVIGVKILPNQLNVTRFAFIVSNKIHKKAITRNLIKRRMRAVINEAIKNIKPGFDIIISARSTIIEDKKIMTFAGIKKNIKYALLKTRILKINNKS